jgi:predicted HTH transcriptional regulator
LNLIQNERITNAAILLFGKNPQKFFITSEVRCAMFYGYDVEKPIASYQVYKGDVFQLVTQATQFVLSNIRSRTGTRDKSIQVDVEFELPIAAVTEAIVNAVCHRDYTSNASVQVMLFKDRLEVWNPGHLPYGMTIEKLKKVHSSMPVNPLLAEPMYLNGTIERMGTGTRDMIKLCQEVGLKAPEFEQEEEFKTVLWRDASLQEEYADSEEVTGNYTNNFTNDFTNNFTENMKTILQEIIIEPTISFSELAKKAGISRRSIINNTNKLKSLGFIERIGDKGGFWKINTHYNENPPLQ